MAITRTAMIDDDGSGTTGTILNNAWKQELYNQIDAGFGAWVEVPFNAANYTALTGAWTVPAGFQQVLRYCVDAGSRTVRIMFGCGGNTTLSAATSTLFIALPGIPSVVVAGQNTFSYWIVPGLGTGVLTTTTPGKISLLRDIAGTAYPAQTSGITYLQGQVFFSY
ncbi:MAG TPA: hypothetical protein VE200_10235 [Xanthobacteraceae bacterium]|nr:hypothetical protein [Xanthobacteraceae bacterium]